MLIICKLLTSPALGLAALTCSRDRALPHLARRIEAKVLRRSFWRGREWGTQMLLRFNLYDLYILSFIQLSLSTAISLADGVSRS